VSYRRASLNAPTFVLLLAVAVMVVVTAGGIALRLARPYPINPWESALVIDAVRWTRGQSVYVAAEDGPATTMYGPLASLVTAGVFQWTGANLTAGRLVSLGSALTLVTLLSWVLTRGKPWPHFFIAWGMLFSLNLPSASYFVDPRPDLPAALFGLLFLLAFVQGERSRLSSGNATERRANGHALTWYTLAIALLLIAFFWKQTAAVLAVVPLLAALLRPGRPRWYRLWRTDAVALLPPLTILAAIATVRLVHPAMYHYLFVVPGQYAIAWTTLGERLRQMLLVVPLAVLLAVGMVLRRDGGASLPHDSRPAAARGDIRLRWTVACLLVTIPTGLVAAAKTGGDRNSYLLAWLALVAFCVLQLDRVFAWLGDRRRSLLGRLALSAGVSFLLFASFIADVDYAGYWAALARNGDGHYRQAVALASSLPGKVLSPGDPTITLQATGELGRTLAVERDAIGWPDEMPDYVRRELAAADWIVRVRGPWDKLNVWLTPESLDELGFARVPQPSRLRADGAYELWRHANRAPLAVENTGSAAAFASSSTGTRP